MDRLSHRFESCLLDGGCRCRRREKLDECLCGWRGGCLCGDGRADDRNLLNLGWEQAHVVDAGDWQEFAYLLKANLCIAARDDGADALALDAPRLVLDLIGDAEPLEQF